MATTETDLTSELQLADLLRRVEVLEEADGKRIEKKNKLTIIAWGGDLDGSGRRRSSPRPPPPPGWSPPSSSRSGGSSRS